MRHRYVSVDDDALGEALSADFVAAGYEHETIVTMIYSGPALEPTAHEVRAMSLDTLRPGPGYEATHFVVRCARRLMERLG